MNSVALRLSLLLFLTWWLAGRAAMAQEGLDPSVPPPSPPLVRLLPDGTTWQLRAESPAAFQRRQAAEKRKGAFPARVDPVPPPEKKAYQVVGISGAFSGGICQAVTEFGDGSRQVAYLTGGRLLLQHPRTGRIAVMETPDELSRPGLVAGNGMFRELAWIAPPFYRGVMVYNQRRCYVYSQYQRPYAWMGDDADGDPGRAGAERGVPLAQAKASPEKRPRLLQTVFIDMETRLPMVLETRDVVWSYEFAGRKASFTLPPEYAAALKAETGDVETIRQKYRIPQ